MRSAMWALAVCGLVGLILRIGTADDRLFDSRRSLYPANSSIFSPKQDLQYFPRSGSERKTTTAPSASGFRSSIPVAAPTKFSSRYIRHQSTPPTASGIVQAGFEQPNQQRPARKIAGSPRLRQPHRASVWDVPRDDRSSKVVHAEFQEGNGSSKRGQIQQIRATDESHSGHSHSATNAATGNIPPAPLPRSARVTVVKTKRKIPRTAATSSRRTPSVTKLSGTNYESPVVTTRWIKRGDINIGQKCRFDLLVKNTGRAPAINVAINAHFPATVRLTSAKPKPAESQDHLTWYFDVLQPGEEKKMEIALIPSQRGDLVTRADVHFTGMTSAIFKVAEPLLEMALEGPSRVMVGESASQVLTVSNPGTGMANDVTINVLVPSGLEHPRGERLAMDIGSLNPGESRTIRLTFAAIGGGEQTVQVQATAGVDLRQSAVAVVDVVAPCLRVAVDGPNLKYLGRSARYTLTVANDGIVPTNNVRIIHKAATGFEFVQADKGGKFDDDSRETHWFVGRLEPGQSTKVRVTLEAVELGDFIHHIRAIAEHGTQANAVTETRIEGSASLAMEIVDLEDPVELGTETAFEIRIRNEGTKSATNVAVSCELPVGVELIGAKGPSPHVAESGVVIFRAIGSLPPGKTALYRIHLRGVEEGNHRYRVRLTSDSIQEPLVLEELTKFYAD